MNKDKARDEIEAHNGANEERVWRDYLKSLGHEFFGWKRPSANDLIPSKDIQPIVDLDKPINYE